MFQCWNLLLLVTVVNFSVIYVKAHTRAGTCRFDLLSGTLATNTGDSFACPAKHSYKDIIKELGIHRIHVMIAKAKCDEVVLMWCFASLVPQI